MKINPAKKLNNEVKKVLRTKNIRSRLAFAFLLFALVLMGSLWILQTVFLETFYEIVAARKTEGVVKLFSIFLFQLIVQIPDLTFILHE